MACRTLSTRLPFVECYLCPEPAPRRTVCHPRGRCSNTSLLHLRRQPLRRVRSGRGLATSLCGRHLIGGWMTARGRVWIRRIWWRIWWSSVCGPKSPWPDHF